MSGDLQNRIKLSTQVMIPVSLIDGNDGQIEGVPRNPRFIRDEKFEALKRSIEEDPEYLSYNDLKVYPLDGRYVVVEGNQRRKAAIELGITEIPCRIYPEDTSAYILRSRVMKDNYGYGENDQQILAEDWDMSELDDWGMDDIIAFDVAEDETEDGVRDLSEDLKRTKGNLSDRFIIPPFSVFDTKGGDWQNRKNMWLSITGDLSETRDGEYGTIGNWETLPMKIRTTSNFDPVLAEVVYKWFCPIGGRIIDPFGGEQTKGVVAGHLGYHYTGMEIRPEQVALNMEKTKQYANVQYICGDSNTIGSVVTERGFDLCFTSPPYYDLEVYSKDDMSALGTFEEFMSQYENIFRQCYELLADDAFLVVKIGEIRDKKTGIQRNFVGENISTFIRIGFKYYNEIILLNPIGTAAIRANQGMLKRKVTKVHQNVLVFYKGDINRLVQRLEPLHFDYKAEDSGDEED